MFNKKNKKEDEIENINPSLTFEIVDGTNILITTNWPTPENNKEAMEVIESFANLIFLSTTGKLLAPTQQAIANLKNQDKMNKDVSKGILHALNLILFSNGHEGFKANKPVVTPRQCFTVRGNQND